MLNKKIKKFNIHTLSYMLKRSTYPVVVYVDTIGFSLQSRQKAGARATCGEEGKLPQPASHVWQEEKESYRPPVIMRGVRLLEWGWGPWWEVLGRGGVPPPSAVPRGGPSVVGRDDIGPL